MAQTSVQSSSTQQPLVVQIPKPPPPPSLPWFPFQDLINGPKREYLRIGVPLYEASIKCDWEVANRILNKRPELVRFSITENAETALHIAASAKGPKHVKQFVKNLVGMMTKEDLELVNKYNNTALYLAAAAGNLETVKIMVKKNGCLPIIPGAGAMLPLHAAVLFGSNEVVKYLYQQSKNLTDDGWTETSRSWLLEKCVESDMFDIALDIVKRTINSVSEFFVGSPEKDTEALQLLRLIWEDIVKLSKHEIDNILRGPKDSNNAASGRIIPAVLQQLIFERLEKMERDCRCVDQVMHLKSLVSQHVVNMHLETQNIISQDKNISGRADQPLEIQKTISEYILRMSDETQNLRKYEAGKEDQAVKQLQVVISMNITKMRGAISLKDKYSSRVMFIAAEVGNTNFLLALIRRSPDLIWKVNDNGLSIFHIAVKNRHEGIYNLLYEIGAMKDMVTPLKDIDGNNMLHLAGMSTRKKNLEDVSGAALQMQRELLWFKVEIFHS
nr:ankyrin repeat-containing domain, PGG domain protein [Tanacetum cinerariifolium]